MSTKMNKFIIITTIFNPTEAVIKFANLSEYRLIVVGDKKTPPKWNLDNCTYLSIDEQDKLNLRLSEYLPYNHYCRKMIGYLYSIMKKADVIIDTDDDNIPYDEWTFPDWNDRFDVIPENLGFINPYSYFSDQKIWPRGLPLEKITGNIGYTHKLKKEYCNVGIWQGLADKNPDVDAVYRLTSNSDCSFKERDPIVLKKGTIAPFNTQNTQIIKNLFPLLYLPTTVSFRNTDILRGLVSQPIMWLYGYQQFPLQNSLTC